MFRCRHRCRRHFLCPSPAAPRKAMPHSPNVTVAVDAGLLISRLAARYAHPPAHLWPEDVPSRLLSTILRCASRTASDPPPRQQLFAPSYEASSRALDLCRPSGAACTRRRHMSPRHNHRTKASHPEWNEPSGFSPSTCLIERRGAALIQRTETSKPFLRNGVFCFLYRCGPCPLWRAFRQDRWARSIAIFKQP